MFVRCKRSGQHEYLQLVENQRIDGRVRQRVLVTLGRRDVLEESGQLDALIASCARFARHTAVLNAHRRGQTPDARAVRIGPALVFERLWRELGLPEILAELLGRRKFEFSVERAVFLTVLHRLFDAGSDRAAEVWRQDYAIRGAEDLQLQHLYRAMAWLGEELPETEQADATPFAPRCTKDLIEEQLFARRRDLFSSLQLVFFDTTSIYFEGLGGQTLGEYGHSKDHRPDRRQMIVGAVLDAEGRPVCSELWPGNVSDARTLIPIVDRLKRRFAIGELCIVADRGMISAETIAALKAVHRDTSFILGCRMRSVNEVSQVVLSQPGRYRTVYGPRQKSTDPSPLKVRQVWVDDRRYIVCRNEEQVRKDQADRQAIVASLREQLQRGPKSLVGNKGYRKYLTVSGAAFAINEQQLRDEARYDGLWVLRTDLEHWPAEDVALTYKDLWTVESLFRRVKSVLQTRPIYHKRDETIRGHVFCSFLALVLVKELYDRMEPRGWRPEWERLKQDLDALQEVTVFSAGQTFAIRTETRGDAGKALQAVRIALGRTIRLLEEPHSAD
jgi:IS4 transposase